MDDLERRIENIERRNERVEADKAWETSWSRRVLLMAFTYIAIAAYLRAIDIARPWLNSVVPAVGFLLSTLTMPFFKRQWMRRRNRE